MDSTDTSNQQPQAQANRELSSPKKRLLMAVGAVFAAFLLIGGTVMVSGLIDNVGGEVIEQPGGQQQQKNEVNNATPEGGKTPLNGTDSPTPVDNGAGGAGGADGAGGAGGAPNTGGGKVQTGGGRFADLRNRIQSVSPSYKIAGAIASVLIVTAIVLVVWQVSEALFAQESIIVDGNVVKEGTETAEELLAKREQSAREAIAARNSRFADAAASCGTVVALMAAVAALAIGGFELINAWKGWGAAFAVMKAGEMEGAVVATARSTFFKTLAVTVIVVVLCSAGAASGILFGNYSVSTTTIFSAVFGALFAGCGILFFLSKGPLVNVLNKPSITWISGIGMCLSLVAMGITMFVIPLTFPSVAHDIESLI